MAQDYNLAAYWWYRGADAGDPSCMYWIGTMFYYGEGVEQNRQEALKWYKKAAQGGEPYAVFYMGYITARGTSGVEKSASRAREYFLQGTQCGAVPKRALYYFDWEVPSEYCFDSVLAQANGGNPAAMCDVAYMYYYGKGTEKNDALAAYWWYAAADAGVTVAMYDVAYMFVNGLGTAQNMNEGKNWIQKFVANINKGKAGEYSRNYTENRLVVTEAPAPVAAPVETPAPALQTAPQVSVDIDAGDPAGMMALLGLENLLEAAALGDLDAAYILGWCYWYGVGVEQNYEEAFAWFYTLAAEEGDPRVYIYVADAYYYGLGVGQDYGEALRWYMLAAEEGDGRAMAMVAQMYREGLGVRQDDTKADKWQSRAAEAGYTQEGADGQPTAAQNVPIAAAPAQLPEDNRPSNLIDLDIDAGQPDEMMRQLGLENLLEAAALGDLDAAYILGWCYWYGVGVEQNYEEAFAWFYTLAAEEGDPRVYIYVADAYYYGLGVIQDYPEAVHWYAAAAEEGNDELKLQVGNYYYRGEIIGQDFAEALKWYLLAAEEGNMIAMGNAADIYNYGRGNVTQDLPRAFQLYKQSAELGNVASMGNLGVCYINGRGTGKNTAEGARWITQAAENGNASAMYNLGQLYENGIGVQKSASTARSWYEKATAAGNENAKKKLGQ